MVKDLKKGDKKPKEPQFKQFIKKRAPIYLAVIAIVIIFIVPEITKGTLQDSFPKNLSEEELRVLETLMAYDGPNEEGLTVMDAISNEIDEEYPSEKIFDDRKTQVNVIVSKLEKENYQVVFDFESYKDDFHYNWNINMVTGDVEGNDEDSKYLIELVDFYD
ncbi:MAG: hypothetical protein OEM79_00445 [Nitrosopumilus sp.]|nr:hypothetical protein [Nitrosopumilus sp.]